MRHVRRNGYRLDRRRRHGVRHCISDGETLCGAAPTFEDTDRENAAACKRHAAILPHWAEGLCPACLEVLP
jgi:hypothetical protein